MTGAGNEAQMRVLVDSVAEAAATNAILKFKLDAASQGDGSVGGAIPTLVKWAAGIVTAVLTSVLTAACIWGVVTLSDLKSAVNTITDRLGDNGVVAQRFENVEQRVEKLEQFHKGGGR